jgi:CD2 antigen cytoplasmic tail-binding protein 2
MFDQPETKKYMKSTDFEGQEWSKPLQFEDEFPIESFNMDQELEQGDFTESGVYVPKKDDSGFHDSWLNELTDQDIEKAKMYHEKTTVVEEVESISLDLLYLKLFAFIKPGENALGAIKRLGQATSITPKWKKKVVKKGVGYSEDEIKVMARQLDELTSIAQKILENDVNVYEKSFEEIALALKLKNLI